MTAEVHDGDVLRPVPADARDTTLIGDYLGWLERERSLRFEGYDDLYAWSVDDLDAFWQSIWDFFEVRSHSPHTAALADATMPGAVWFPGATLNYAEHAVGAWRDPDGVALIERSQTRGPRETTRGELADQVARARAGLQRLGVGKRRPRRRLPPQHRRDGRRLPRHAEPRRGVGGLRPGVRPPRDRRPLRPDRAEGAPGRPRLRLRRQGDRPQRRGRRDPRRASRRSSTSSWCRTATASIPDAIAWDELLAEPGPLEFDAVPFDHPMVVLFTSGTTGKPKPIVHCHGGLLVEQLKSQGLLWDLRDGDRLLWFSTTAWMLWNTVIVGAAARRRGRPHRRQPAVPGRHRSSGAGPRRPARPSSGCRPATSWPAARRASSPRGSSTSPAVRQIGCAGAPLATEGYVWIVEQLGQDVLLNVGQRRHRRLHRHRLGEPAAAGLRR